MKVHVTRSKDKINSIGGSVLSASLLKKSGLNTLTSELHDVTSHLALTLYDILASYTGLLLSGHTAYDDIKLFAENTMFSRVFELEQTPPAETLRQRLDNLGINHLEPAHALIKSAANNLIKLKDCSFIKTEFSSYIPVDFDVSPMDNSKTSKEECSKTYKGSDGFAPMFAYIGR